MKYKIIAGLFLLCAALVLPFEFSQSAADEIKIDFSYAGYSAGGENLPQVPAVLTVCPSGGDDTDLLQAAIDELSKLPVQSNDFRGALVLAPGKFRVSRFLRLKANGIVVRGSADENNPTVIVATGFDRRSLIQIGADETPLADNKIGIGDETVPAGSLRFSVDDASDLRAGDRIEIRRPSTKEWIDAIGMNKAEGAFADQRVHWLAGSRDLVWDRRIVAVDPVKKQLTIDAPVTFALEKRFGGGTVAKISGNFPAARIGVENLILESEYDAKNPKDEAHSWIAVQIENAEDVWVSRLRTRHFAGSAVRAGGRARRVTIENVHSEAPVSEIGGYRRQTFLVEGQQILVTDCTSENGLNDFAVGLNAAGPNVFLNSTAKNALASSGSFESLSAGTLYENVRLENAGLLLDQSMTRAQGGGFTAVNSVVWNTRAAEIKTDTLTGAENVVRKSDAPLYERQLVARLGKLPAGSSLAPKNESSREFRLKKSARTKNKPPVHPLKITGGRFAVDDRILWGGMLNGAWWKGQNSAAIARATSGMSITRFSPGRNGFGLTEDLTRLAAWMKSEKLPFYNGGPGLWYDRRRDAHTVAAQPDGQVWAPFYELPWARSGQGTAFDGLSKYDLTRFNEWYFERTRQFAEIADENGLVYYHNLYNTHNLLETAAHWVDFPFRAVNNVNDTALEPVWEARNTVHTANEFYDPRNPKLRALHRLFIRKNLDALGKSENVVFILAFQFSGPLEFQRFFLDTVREWEKENGRKVKIALITSKDITDAILNDPVRGRQISVVDMRYWQYRPDGALWAPRGGQNLAFREIITKDFGRSGDAPNPTTPEQSYRQVREYRDRFPDKAIVAWHNGNGQIPALMAGAAQILMRNPNAGQSQGAQSDNTFLDDFLRANLSAELLKMSPQDNLLTEGNWCLADKDFETVLVHSLKGAELKVLNSFGRKTYQGVWFNEQSGQTKTLDAPVALTANSVISKPVEEGWLLLLRAKK